MPNPGYWFHRIVWTAGEKTSVAKAFHYTLYLGLLDFWPVPCPKMCRVAERSEAPAAVFFARPTLTRGASAPQTLCIMLWQTVHIGLWCLGFSQYFSSTHQSACNARCPQGQVIRKNSWDRGLLILLTMVFFQSVRNIARLHSSREIQSHLIHVMYSMYSKHVWATFLVWEELPDIPWPSFNAQNAANTTCSGLFNGPEFALAADVARNDEAPGCDCDRFPCWATKLRDGSPEIQHISTSHLETSTWVLRVTSCHFILMGMSAQHKPMPSAIPEARWGPICTPLPGFFRSYPASSRSPDILQTPVMFSICQSNLVWGLILAEPASKEQD